MKRRLAEQLLQVGELAVGEQTQTLLEAQGVDLGQRTLLGELARHRGELELLQLLDGGMA